MDVRMVRENVACNTLHDLLSETLCLMNQNTDDLPHYRTSKLLISLKLLLTSTACFRIFSDFHNKDLCICRRQTLWVDVADKILKSLPIFKGVFICRSLSTCDNTSVY